MATKWKRCSSVYSVDLQCSKTEGHTGAHVDGKRNRFWTGDDIIWDYEVDDFRAIV